VHSEGEKSVSFAATTKRTSKLDSLPPNERKELIARLYKKQNGLCYVCRQSISLHVHAVDIDHIIALARGGADDESNWALTHAAHNRSKGTRDLQLIRILYEFRQHLEKYTSDDADGAGRNFTLKEALAELRPHRMEVGIILRDSSVEIAWQSEDGKPMSEKYPLLADSSTPPAKSFVGMMPFTCLHHDEDINPRSIADLETMIEEFYNGNPQLQPSLATLTIKGTEGKAPILVFDGQHKAAAQLYARRERLLVRVFVNVDREKLKETNYRAHTKLAQVHFPQLINDKVGADLFKEEFNRYLQGADPTKISEDTFLSKGIQRVQRSEYRSYFGNFLRYEVLVGKAGAEQNEILSFTETVMPRSTRYPLSYDTLQKAMLDMMLFLKPAKDTVDLTSPYRQLERENLIRLLNIFVEEVLANGRFDLNLGVRRIEEKLEKDPQSIPDSHLRAYRICRKSAMMVWSEELKRAIRLLLGTKMRYKIANWGERRPLWAQVLDEDWQQIRKMIQAIRDHKVWGESINPDIVQAIASTKQKEWKDILLKGTLPGRHEQLLPLLDSGYMFKAASER
jgi:hypothetical protein